MTEDHEILEAAGVRVPLDPMVLSPPIIETMRAGRYENARVKNLRKMIELGDRIVDVGGGIGFTSTMMAQQRKAAHIVSIEGHPGVQEMAARVHRLNGVEVELRCALVVTENTGGPTRPFYISRHFWGSSMLPDVKGLERVVEIPVMTYEDVIADYAPNMLVIDLEVTKEYLRPDSPSGPIEKMALTGINKVVLHLVRHLSGDAGIRRVFDFMSSQGFVYDIDYSRGSVVLFRRLKV